MNEKTGLQSIIPSKKEIGLMALRGFGLFLTISGMVGITIILGPLNYIVRDLTFTLVFDSELYAFLLFLLLAVIGGAIEFLSNEGLKALEKQR